MFCPNCGAKLPEDSVFCENCGTKVTGTENTKKETQPKKGLPVPLLIGAVIILAAVIFLLLKGQGNGNGGTDSPEEIPAPVSAEVPQDSDSTADQGYTAENDPAAITAGLSTAEHALATDFEWFLDYELLGGEYQGKLVSDRSLTTLITKDQADLLQGGWKAYMYCADEGANPEDGARYFNAELHPAGDDFSVTMNWKYMFDAVSGSSIEETGSDLFKGNWNGDGTVSVKSDYAMVTFDTFLINQDATAEYALGTFYWISGETYRIALMRVREF